MPSSGVAPTKIREVITLCVSDMSNSLHPDPEEPARHGEEYSGPAIEEEPRTLWGWFVRCITVRYADLNGRARRFAFWSFVAFYIAFLLLAVLICCGETFFAIRGLGPTEAELANPGYYLDVAQGTWTFWLIPLVMALLFIPLLTVTVRRFHDVGISTGVFLILFAVHFFFLVMGLIDSDIAEGEVEATLNFISELVVLGFNLFVVVVALMPGKKGPNKYGPDPKRRGAQMDIKIA